MFTAQEKLKIKSREAIKPSIKAAGIIRNENSTRLWWKENDKTGSMTIVYDNPAILKQVAQVLKECVIIDDFDVCEVNGEVLNVQLYKREYYEYQAKGKTVHCTIKNKIAWRELTFKNADVKEIANYVIYQRCIKGQPLRPLAKIFPMFSRNANTKTAA